MNTDILTFHLKNRKERFAMNVLKIKEVMKTPEITKTPTSRKGSRGMISLRGDIMPIFDLSDLLFDSGENENILLVCHFHNKLLGFLVDQVLDIKHIDVENLKDVSDENLGINSIYKDENNELYSLIDTEFIISNIYGEEKQYDNVFSITTQKEVFFIDDSLVARKQISNVLDKMKVKSNSEINGEVGFKKLKQISDNLKREGKVISDRIGCVLVDLEMPVKDGIEFTKAMKNDPDLKILPIIIHSSLSGQVNLKTAKDAGADEYITKFHPDELCKVITNMLK